MALPSSDSFLGKDSFLVFLEKIVFIVFHVFLISF